MDGTATLEAPQHMRALERANQIRLARSALKRRIAQGQVDPADVITGCPREVENMTIVELLSCQRRWGAIRCRRFLKEVQIKETRTIGAMTRRERTLVVAVLTPQERDGSATSPLWPAWAA